MRSKRHTVQSPTSFDRRALHQGRAASDRRLKSDDVKEKLLEVGLPVVADTPELAETLKRDVQKWGTLIREMGVRLE